MPVSGRGQRLSTLSRPGLSLGRGGLTTLLGSVGFVVADGFVNCALDGAWSVVAVCDEVGVVDVDGDGLAGVEPAQGDDLARDHDGADGGNAVWTVTASAAELYGPPHQVEPRILSVSDLVELLRYPTLGSRR